MLCSPPNQWPERERILHGRIMPEPGQDTFVKQAWKWLGFVFEAEANPDTRMNTGRDRALRGG